MAFGSGAVTKPGTIQGWGGTTALDGWLICDGSAVSRTLYTELYAVIGDTYGAGDGSTTFNLPNLIGLTSDNVPCKGNGYVLGLTNKSQEGFLIGKGPSDNNAHISASTLPKAIGVAYTDSNHLSATTGVGVTTDQTKSGVVSSLSSAAQKSAAIIKY